LREFDHEILRQNFAILLNRVGYLAIWLIQCQEGLFGQQNFRIEVKEKVENDEMISEQIKGLWN
jgi:hypothetical protein